MKDFLGDVAKVAVIIAFSTSVMFGWVAAADWLLWYKQANSPAVLWIQTGGMECGHEMRPGDGPRLMGLPAGPYEITRDSYGEFHVKWQGKGRKTQMREETKP